MLILSINHSSCTLYSYVSLSLLVAKHTHIIPAKYQWLSEIVRLHPMACWQNKLEAVLRINTNYVESEWDLSLKL
jgi:hypothetical protein